MTSEDTPVRVLADETPAGTSGGSLTGRLREALIDLESGVADDVHAWREPLHVDRSADA
jgi:hypothetical protein